MTVPVVETERLVLRGWRPEDRAPMARANADAEVTRWIGDGAPLDRAASDAFVDAIVEQWRARGFGLWAVEERAGGAMLGLCGLSVPWFLPSVLPAVEIGWRLERSAWGRGYATEAAAAALAHAFDDLGLTEVIATIFPENIRSVRVAEKLGMVRTGERNHPSGACVAVYRIRP
ncbi:MAG: GNAT family N-acetyltransferase [Solirubrobacterales bacterium]|nr:GNAT family N-acetyltransferase [Solirubrobacterales bacterium]